MCRILLKGRLGDMIIVMGALRNAWGNLSFICSHPVILRLANLLQLAVAPHGVHDFVFGYDLGVVDMANMRSLEAKYASHSNCVAVQQGDGVLYCPNASGPSKEWPYWHLLPAAPMAGSWHPDLVGAIMSADTVVANHSGPAHLAALLGRRVITLTNRDWHINPKDSLVLGGDAGWPSVDSVIAALAIPNKTLL